MVWSKRNSGYHGIGFHGYVNSPLEAGKFLLKEVEGWNSQDNEVRPLKKAA